MMRPLSKVLFIVALFAMTVCLSYACLFFMKNLLSYSEYRYVNFYSSHHEPFPQVLVIGNSRAGSNFSDDAFLPTDLLNLGEGGTTFGILSSQAIDMIEVNSTLKYVIIESYFLGNKYSVSHHGHIQALFSHRVKAQVLKSLSGFEKMITEIFPSYWLNTNNFMGALGLVILDRPNRQGFNDKHLALDSIGVAMSERMAAQTYGRIDSDTISQLSELRLICETNGVSLFIIATPIHRLRSDSPGWSSHIAEMQRISSDLGVKFYDFSTIFREERMFADTVHLNNTGADYMSEVLFRKTLGNETSL